MSTFSSVLICFRFAASPLIISSSSAFRDSGLFISTTATLFLMDTFTVSVLHSIAISAASLVIVISIIKIGGTIIKFLSNNFKYCHI
ncbi:Uncharacterised protein [Mycobacteroides abscessus subsp. abscessus]|nr:Uncharacterised protein [Mycobacteroides abscessus subsp. abscessus]